jgi:hypothetical protein
MISKPVRGSVAALGVGALLCGGAVAQTQYQQYAPYGSQYTPAQQQYQQQYQQYYQQYYQQQGAPPQAQQYQQQYAPAAQQYAPAAQQYAPAAQQYAPAQAAAYTALPDYCNVNNTAIGVAGGAAVGALAGGGGLRSLVGAAIGAAAGGAIGSQSDEQCRQLAIQRAYEYAAAQQAAIEQQVAQQAARQAGALQLPASAYEPVYVDYATPSDNRRHRVTVKRLSSFSEPATRQICDTFTRIDADLDSGASSTTTARRCKGPDGQWRDA